MNNYIVTKFLKNWEKKSKRKLAKINNIEEEKMKLLNKFEYTDKKIIYRALCKNKSNLNN